MYYNVARMTSAVARVGVVGSTVARFGVVKPAGDFLQPKVIRQCLLVH